jgi:tRNA threonylcarbamoyladenosine biosynthesis protein TsaB
MGRDESLILSIDTATPCSSVALTQGTRKNGKVLASISLSSRVTHSRRLLAAIDYLMSETEVDWPSIEAVAVSIGPGSFTGLRIGMATAKGLVFGADRVMVGVSTLDGLASKCAPSPWICSVLDARKNEVYAAFYRTDAEGLTVLSGIPVVISPEKLAECITEPVVLVGDGVNVYGDLWKTLLEGKVSYAPAHLHQPSAACLGFIGKEKLQAGDILNMGEAVPSYIRASDAELNLVRKRDGNDTSETSQG